MRESINSNYDVSMFDDVTARFYGGSDYFNFGYWTWRTRSQKEASENLLARLLEFLPEQRGTILDVACGLGATSRELSRNPAFSVTAINISQKQLLHCRTIAPRAALVLADATELPFGTGSFDNVICVEAAFHFETRQAFLAEAYRVLRPGGRLVLSDILYGQRTPEGTFVSARNYVASLADYRALFTAASFADVAIARVNRQTVERHGRRFSRFAERLHRKGAIDGKKNQAIQRWSKGIRRHIRDYVLVAAIKPA